MAIPRPQGSLLREAERGLPRPPSQQARSGPRGHPSGRLHHRTGPGDTSSTEAFRLQPQTPRLVPWPRGNRSADLHRPARERQDVCPSRPQLPCEEGDTWKPWNSVSSPGVLVTNLGLHQDVSSLPMEFMSKFFLPTDCLSPLPMFICPHVTARVCWVCFRPGAEVWWAVRPSGLIREPRVCPQLWKTQDLERPGCGVQVSPPAWAGPGGTLGMEPVDTHCPF